jgi:hypothetical protein
VTDLKAQWQKKGKEELHNFCQNTKSDIGKWYFERYYSNGSSPRFLEIKVNRLVFVSVNRMRAGHLSLKASLSRFSIVSTAECECGDRLRKNMYARTVNCTRTKGQQWRIFCLRTAKTIPKVNYRGPKTRGKKICARRLLLHKQKFFFLISHFICNLYNNNTINKYFDK